MSLDINCSDWDKFYSHLEIYKEMLDDALYGLNNNRLRLFYSRIYYSCFHLINALFYKYGILNDKKEISSHRQLMVVFNKIFINDEKIFDNSFFKILRDTFTRRGEADYSLIVSFNDENSIEIYNKIKIFIDTLKNKINEGLAKLDKDILE
jgi:uncharacterized protein (UPF0332 family)